MPNKVRAKFQCTHIIDYGNSEEVHLRAVYSDKGENKSFTEATPDGAVRIRIDKDAPAYGSFQVDKHYYADFSEAPES